MTEVMHVSTTKDHTQPTSYYKSVHPGRLVPTASTFAPVPNYGGERLSLPLVGGNKKGFASGKLGSDPNHRKQLLGRLTRASAYTGKDKAQRHVAQTGRH